VDNHANHADDENIVDTDIDSQMDTQYGSQSAKCSLWPQNPLRNGHLYHLSHGKFKGSQKPKKQLILWQPTYFYPTSHY